MIAPVAVAGNNKDKNQKVFKKFHALDETGIARVGESLNNGDIYINKYSPVMLNNSANTDPSIPTR